MISGHTSRLTEEHLSHPNLQEQGLFKLSGRRQFPPGSFIGDMLERAGRKQRKLDEDLVDRLSPEKEGELVEKLKAAAKAPPPRADANLDEEDANTTIERSAPRTRGRFPMMPRDLKPTRPMPTRDRRRLPARSSSWWPIHGAIRRGRDVDDLRFDINLLDDGQVVKRDGEFLGTWDTDETDAFYQFTPDGVSAHVCMDPYRGPLCDKIRRWLESRPPR